MALNLSQDQKVLLRFRFDQLRLTEGLAWAVSDVGEARCSVGKEGTPSMPGRNSREAHREWSVLSVTKSRRKEGESVLS